MTHPMMRTWGVQYVLPTVLLLFSLFILLPFIDDPDMIWAAIATPLTILLGFVVRPEKVWITPVAVTMLVTTAIVIAALMGEISPRTSLPLLYLWDLALIGLPLLVWTALGKVLGLAWGDR
jgi:hypothetical protein